MFHPSNGNPKYFKIRIIHNYAKLEVLTTESMIEVFRRMTSYRMVNIFVRL